jgi:dTDP-4-amino-4,6-dideoxygalactose transaminase
VLEAMTDRIVTLPMGPTLTDEQIAHVGESVKAALDKLGGPGK